MKLSRRNLLRAMLTIVPAALIPFRSLFAESAKCQVKPLLFPGRYDADVVLVRNEDWGWCIDRDRSGRRRDRYQSVGDFMRHRGGNWCLFFPRKGEGRVAALYRNAETCARWADADRSGHALPL